ncbi:hypothetical protein SSS_02899 [Sarcoptes scabiei]|uniref:Uncharacterized protein n=1 Tax=Sarcoptes scabiei TaxID=52283 RepID=A0A834RC30_SARSC|nr:hypothetical protein SSS_02899 [Sarcoptes scabiei]
MYKSIVFIIFNSIVLNCLFEKVFCFTNPISRREYDHHFHSYRNPSWITPNLRSDSEEELSDISIADLARSRDVFKNEYLDRIWSSKPKFITRNQYESKRSTNDFDSTKSIIRFKRSNPNSLYPYQIPPMNYDRSKNLQSFQNTNMDVRRSYQQEDCQYHTLVNGDSEIILKKLLPIRMVGRTILRHCVEKPNFNDPRYRVLLRGNEKSSFGSIRFQMVQ